ncbi:proliferating cell nuclear antigen [Ditylenchus destructor]|uniref:DNA sliding clamp PCNA n=1 Tax=Ditylenchus destructor TaxID=166010 RepID=A0AAD4NB66_9BILA|nr:proliferating cell nuclear antigen [Ditylenchus destructor]
MDTALVVLVSLKLENRLFEEYRCDRTLNIGLNVNELYKVMKWAKKQDSCLIQYDEYDRDKVMITFVDPCERKQETKMRQMEIQHDRIEVPDGGYSCVIDMPSTEFHRTCKDIATFSETLVITASLSGGVEFSGCGDSVETTVSYPVNQPNDIHKKDGVQIVVKEDVKAMFTMKYMNHFANAHNLSERVKISLSNNEAIRIEYDLDYGYLRFYLGSKIEGDIY